jgi:acetyltransferase-like isoleucine patch superfamily enzyme
VNTILLVIVFVMPPFLKPLVLRWLCHARIERGVKIGWFSTVSAARITLGEHSVIQSFTVIRLNGEFALGANSEISSFNLIYGVSSLALGADCYVGPQSIINAEEPVRMGDGSALGPRSMVFTHGSFLPYTEGYWVKLGSVTIGNKVWCAAGVFIHPGVEIGDNTFVNSMSVVTQSIPPGSVVEGNPARVIYTMSNVKREMTPARVDAAYVQMLHNFAEMSLRRELRVREIAECAGQLRLNWRGHVYAIILVRSRGEEIAPVDAERQIYIVNRTGWDVPTGAMVFEATTLRTRFHSDEIHTALRLFLQRYYGVRFRDVR